jgi:hypothetical protein
MYETKGVNYGLLSAMSALSREYDMTATTLH